MSLDAASGWNIGTVVKDAPRQTLASILDGVSNTLASSEVIKGRDGTMMDGSAAFDRRGYTHWGDACSFTTLYTPNNAAPDRFDNGSRCANTASLPCSFGGPPYYIIARSRHPGGVNAGMLDGSVRFVSDSIHWNYLAGTRLVAGRRVRRSILTRIRPEGRTRRRSMMSNTQDVGGCCY